MNIVDTYAQRVVDGELPAGKYHRLACVRHLRDRGREASPEFPYRFEIDKAERFFRFAEHLKHYKGEWAGQALTLSDFQKFRLGSVFGWRHTQTGARRFTTAYNEIPRKSGKSLEAGAVALYVTFFEGEPGAEGYVIATKEKQASLVFNDSKRLVQSSGLRSRIAVQTKNLHRDETSSKLEPLGSDSDTTDGLNPHCTIVDEFHGFKTRGLIDVMESATGARRNPLMYQITTAGKDPVSPCGDQHDYACKILDQVFEDFATDSFFACIASADPDDDWQSEETWKKANPHYGISVKPDDMRKLALKAKNMPSAAAEFKQKRLNLWVNADAPWLSIDGWRAGQSAQLTREQFESELLGQPCWGGIDLSSKIDLTAFALLFPRTATRNRWRLLLWAFTPADTLEERAHRDRAPYGLWRDRGILTTSPGKRIDYALVRACVQQQKARFKIQAIGFDPYNAENLEADLKADGFSEEQVLEVPQTYLYMSPPAKDFEADVLEGLVDAGGNPLMAWSASNAVVQRDGKDNIYPVKKKSRGRIDPLVAALIALALEKRLGRRQAATSVYASRGALIVNRAPDEPGATA